MKDSLERWHLKWDIDIDEYFQKKQKDFRFYNSNIYILNHVNHVTKYRMQ